jgi:hypothetical protein
MIDAPQIFLSYRRVDSTDTTGRIYDWLKQHFGGRVVFRDLNNIPLGVDFRAYIDQTLSQCYIMLVIIGPNWIEIKDNDGRRRLDDPEDFVRIEVESALARKIRVVPLLVQGATMPKESELPGLLKGIAYRNGISIRRDLDFDHDMDRLIKELEKYVPSVKKTPIEGEGYLSKFADLKFVGKVAVAEFLCLTSVLLSIWVAGVYMVPLTAGVDQIILYALGFSVIITALLGLSNWRMRYDDSWISTVGGTTLLAIIWAFMALLF